jgi:hypothetical protein
MNHGADLIITKGSQVTSPGNRQQMITAMNQEQLTVCLLSGSAAAIAARACSHCMARRLRRPPNFPDTRCQRSLDG